MNNKLEVTKILKKDKSLAKRKGPRNCTILHIAAFFGNEEITQVCVNNIIKKFWEM